jgi:aspartyl-tRNA(Asn)/glutamyl-tRNA(Gln) amidotransferase subunit B
MYEILRQAEALEDGEIIRQETRHWDPSLKRTIVMRVKETADDYRLFPEPDLAPYDLSDEWIDGVRAKLPELPDEKSKRYATDFGLSNYDAKHVVEHTESASLFEAAIALEKSPAPEFAKGLANLIINDLTAWVNANDDEDMEGWDKVADCPLSAKRLHDLVGLTALGKISKNQQKEVFASILAEDKDPEVIVKEKGFEQVSDTGAIESVVDKVLSDNPDKVEQYKGGKTGLIGFFVGQCMKEMQGKGNPQMINQLLAEKLG